MTQSGAWGQNLGHLNSRIPDRNFHRTDRCKELSSYTRECKTLSYMSFWHHLPPNVSTSMLWSELNRTFLDRAFPLAELLRPLIFSALNHSSSQPCGFEPSSGHMWDKPSSACGWSGVFSQGSPIFAPPYDWLGLKRVNESTGCKTQKQKKIKFLTKNIDI